MTTEAMGYDTTREVEQDREPRPQALWPKKCGCGRSHSQEAWQALRYVGELAELVDDDGRPYGLTLRDCACGSTLAVEVRP